MDKSQKYMPSFIALALLILSIVGSVMLIMPKRTEVLELEDKCAELNRQITTNTSTRDRMKLDAAKLASVSLDVAKKIYYPTEADLGNESIFFTLYTDMLDLAKQNNIKIRSIDYKYYPEKDKFVTLGGKSKYFVCDLDMRLVSNYRELRNFIETLYQYPYYIKFNNLVVEPYPTDKTILLSNFSVRLYAHTDIEPIDLKELNSKKPLKK